MNSHQRRQARRACGIKGPQRILTIEQLLPKGRSMRIRPNAPVAKSLRRKKCVVHSYRDDGINVSVTGRVKPVGVQFGYLISEESYEVLKKTLKEIARKNQAAADKTSVSSEITHAS